MYSSVRTGSLAGSLALTRAMASLTEETPTDGKTVRFLDVSSCTAEPGWKDEEEPVELVGAQQLHGLVQLVDGEQVGRCLQVLLLQAQLLDERLRRPSPRLKTGWKKKKKKNRRVLLPRRHNGRRLLQVCKKKKSPMSTHRSEREQVVIQLSFLCGQLQRPLQVTTPQSQVRDGVVVSCLNVSLL